MERFLKPWLRPLKRRLGMEVVPESLNGLEWFNMFVKCILRRGEEEAMCFDIFFQDCKTVGAIVDP